MIPPVITTRRSMLAAVALVSVVGLGYGVTRSPLLDLDVVRVEGGTHTAAPDVAHAGGLDDHPQLADIDPAAVAARIERLPWVQTATVTRHWPRSVEISLQERSPVAAFAVPAAGPGRAAGPWAIVDDGGRVLEQVGEVPPGMVTVDAPEAAPVPGERISELSRPALGVLERLPATLQDRVTAIRIGEDRTLELRLSGGPPVRFGPAEQVQAKLVAVETLLARTNLRGVTAIDVRVPTAPVLTRG